LGRGAISGWKDAPEVKPSRRLEETVPQELRRQRKSDSGIENPPADEKQEQENRLLAWARDLAKRRN
jgi:hypothetical protein